MTPESRDPENLILTIQFQQQQLRLLEWQVANWKQIALLAMDMANKQNHDGKA